MTTAETTTATANGNGTVATAKTAKQAVRMQFLCEKRQLEFKEEIPVSLIGTEAVLKPAMPKMFELTLGPIVMKHAGEALDACEDKCSSKGCERDATTIVATPMSVSFLVYFSLSMHYHHPLLQGGGYLFRNPRFPILLLPLVSVRE